MRDPWHRDHETPVTDDHDLSRSHDEPAGRSADAAGGSATAAPARDDESHARGHDSVPWHAYPTEQVLERLDVDPDTGLDDDDAARRLEEHGPNLLTAEEPRSNFEIALSQFKSPLIYILLIAGVVTILIEEYKDAAVIAAVLVINAVIGFIQERRADRSVHALMELASPKATVVRGGREKEVEAVNLVPGDVVLLTSGSRVPADLRLVRTTTLKIDESLLTGESEPTDKTTTAVDEKALAADRTSMAHMGSSVTSGRGRGVVAATATDTQLGAIAESIRQEEQPPTPLQQRMHRFANVIAVVILATTAVAFLLGVALDRGTIDEMFLTAVALAVAVIPEGLPVAFTVAMALGVRRMAQRNALIRSLPAVETLGSTDTIGSDKTGTLTTNRMTALRAWTPVDTYAILVDGRDPLEGDELPSAADTATIDGTDALSATLRTGVISNESDLIIEEDGEVEHRGDPTETALLEAAHRLDIDLSTLRDGSRLLANVPFESELRYSYVVVDEDGPVLRLKGAPERVLDLCTSMLGPDGPTDLDRDAALEAAERMARRGLRVLAMAERRLDLDVDRVHAEDPPAPEELMLTGMVGMQDPPRPGVRESIENVRHAGMRVVMITGDHVVTARAIARDLRLIDDEDAPALTGAEMEEIDDERLRELVPTVNVYARVAPEHKLRVVKALQYHGDVVAVTGDGVNDAPALKAADIGVAMGREGTDVAREASDMVLTDDNFISIANAVEEGRVVFDNVRKVTFFLLSTGAAAIVAILYSIVADLPLPYVPAALLWLNVVTNGLQDVALAFEPGEPDVLDRPPRKRSEGIVTWLLWERTLLLGVTMAVGSLWAFQWAIDKGLTEAEQRGVALTTLVIAMAVHVYNARSERRSIIVTNVRGNLFLLISTIVAVTIHILASYWGPTQTLLQIEPVTAGGWQRIAVVAVAVAVVSEIHKAVRSRR